MNNKKYLKIGSAVLLSVILLITAVLTGYASNNAYEEFKMLLREEHVQLNTEMMDYHDLVEWTASRINVKGV